MMTRLLALVLLLLFLPLFLVVATFILLEDGWPIFFLQERVGKNKLLFWVYKFRTMKLDTPNVAKHLLLDRGAYHLKCGSLIRGLSIDELPNLINIIKGEMNFIGPRPALYNEYELIEMREKAGVNSLKPGLTGLAQVNGRDFLTNEEKCRYDSEYLEKRSFALDVKIIYLSFMVVATPFLSLFKGKSN